MTAFIFVSFRDIDQKSLQRPPGYREMLRKKAYAVDEDGLHFTQEVYSELVTMHNSQATAARMLERTRSMPAMGSAPRAMAGAGVVPRARAKRTPLSSVPREKWPLVVRVLTKLGHPDDRGVGDTVARLAGVAGGEVVKRWYKKIVGRDCGCTDRQAKLNALYPYTQVESSPN
jgi:hypothetical protein